jgi:DNA-directed RNA polymerase specialized sigma24 family protein
VKEEVSNIDSRPLDNSGTSPGQEEYFLQTTPLIRQITHSKLNSSYYDAVEDIAQKVLLKLWQWRVRRAANNLSADEWQRLANTATQNEIKTFYTRKFHSEVPLSEVEDEGNTNYKSSGDIASNEIEGNTNVETRSMIVFIWKAILDLSPRQRFALLLQKPELITQLIASGQCSVAEIGKILDLSESELLRILEELPYSDEQIGLAYELTYSEKLMPVQVWKARSKARLKMAKILKELL